jgi:branched-chain amino acid transport system permease protein
MVGIPSLRIHDDYFAIATFAFQVITFSVMMNWVSFTGGPMGLSGIPQAAIMGWKITTHPDFLLLVLLLCIITVWISHRIVNSPFGRVLKAIREDEIFVQALGKNVAYYKVIIFVIGGGMASMAGVMYAYYISFIDPTSFTVMESIFIISIVIIGGAGNIWGAVIGASILVILPEALRFMGMPTTIAANMRQVIYGALLVIFMLYRPQGLIGEYSFKK